MSSLVLQFVPLAPDVWVKLQQIPRAGWVNRGVPHPETVAEHTISLLSIAMEAEPLTQGGRTDLLAMLEVHDWPESRTSDEVILTNNPVLRSIQKAAKRARELAAMKEICAPLGEKGKEILDHWLRFESSPDPIADLAREIDKFQVLEQALLLEKREHIPLFAKILESDRQLISHPYLVKRIAELEQDYNEYCAAA